MGHHNLKYCSWIHKYVSKLIDKYTLGEVQSKLQGPTIEYQISSNLMLFLGLGSSTIAAFQYISELF